MLALMSKYWWVALVRGVLAILFGLMALAWPALTFASLVLLFGAWAFVSGITLLAGAFGGRAHGQDWWLMLIQGGLGVAVGIMTFFAPGLTEVALLLYIAVWAMATGVIEILTAVRLRHEIEGEGWMILSGLISVLFAFVLMGSPGTGAMALISVIGFFALFAGALLVVAGIRLRGLKTKLGR